MLDSLYLPLLLAQQESTTTDTIVKVLSILGLFALVIVVPIFLGSVIAKAVRMRGYEWKIGLILATLAVGLMILVRSYDFEKRKFTIPLGVDLKGGVILIYEIDTSASVATKGATKQPADINIQDLVQALGNRINPSGTKEIVIRPYGDRQVEIIIPEVDTEEVRSIKRKISTAGSLEFRIVATPRKHQSIITLAEEQAQDPDPARRISKRVVRDDKMVGFWAQAAKEKLRASDVVDTISRDAKTGQIIDFRSLGQVKGGKQKLEDYLAENGLENIDVLLATDDGCDVTGDNLGVVSASVDEYLNPCVNFRLRGDGVSKFRLLTSENLPVTDTTPPIYYHLGIMLDERLLSFPRLITTISDSGRITGDFKQEEVDFLVGILRAGRLPATLKKDPISENQIGSMLGDDTIQKGKTAIFISLLAVLVFVAIYYRFAGIVACFALLANLIFILAVMVLLNAPMTLPGLAGLVLTVGMSVDANVLIFERIREELQRGAALRMAIRNGFDKATTTIVDANVTTLITAMVLYAIGTDQIRGFAVTLILGILMSMYTAIFCSRVIFDIAERRHWITELHMMRFLGSTHLDFIGKRTIAIAGSVILIVIGLIAVAFRGEGIFDIDFTGGVSVTMVLQESMPPDEVRSRLTQHFEKATPPVVCTVNTVNVEGRPDNSVYKIDADMETATQLEHSIQETFRDASGGSLLLAYTMDVQDVKQVTVSRPPADSGGRGAAKKPGIKAEAETAPNGAPGTVPAKKTDDAAAAPPAEANAEKAETESNTEKQNTEKQKENSGKVDEKPPVDGQSSRRGDLPGSTVLAYAGPATWSAQDEKADEGAKQDETAEPGQPPAKTSEPAAPVAGETAPPAKEGPIPATGPAGGAEAADEIRTVAKLMFGDEINAPTLRDKIRIAYGNVHPGVKKTVDDAEPPDVPGLFVDTDEIFDWEQTSVASSRQWFVSMVATQAEAENVLQRMKRDLAETPVFPSSSKIGGKVAGDTRNLAIAALVASLFGIVAYIWIRFQRVVFGVAAVIALVHDVLITLGAIAISAYVARSLGFLLIEEFKISLPIVAAFLTLIGYSLNDTIVVFDRIREVRGKSPDLTAEMINTSINQTLSRTLLTSLTTLIVVVILYAIGGQGIHGFAFSLVVGIIVGTYSSVFIASPILLWMFKRGGTVD